MQEFITVFGTFSNNEITTETQVIECITYTSTRKKIEGLTAFFNLIWNDDINMYIISDYVVY